MNSVDKKKSERSELDLRRLRDELNLPMLYGEAYEAYPKGTDAVVERVELVRKDDTVRVVVRYRPINASRQILESFSKGSIIPLLRFAEGLSFQNLAELEGLRVKLEWICTLNSSRPHLVPVAVLRDEGGGEEDDKEK